MSVPSPRDLNVETVQRTAELGWDRNSASPTGSEPTLPSSSGSALLSYVALSKWLNFSVLQCPCSQVLLWRQKGFKYIHMCCWRRKWQPTPVFLAGESHGQRSLAATIHGVTKSQARLNTRTRDIELPAHIQWSLGRCSWKSTLGNIQSRYLMAC